MEFRQQQIKKKRFATANLPCVQGSDSEFCPYSEDVGDQFSANSDSSGLERIVQQTVGMQFQQPLAFLHIALPSR